MFPPSPRFSRHALASRLAIGAFLGASAFAFVACGGSSTTNDSGKTTNDASSPTPVTNGDDDSGVSDLDANVPKVTPDAAKPIDAGEGIDSALGPPGFPADPTDGTPTRQACTGNFGSGLTAIHGRLDGTLVAIVQPKTNPTCNSDTHVHLQVLMNGSIYDVATNLETLFYTQDLALPGGAWAEGWNTDMTLDYASLGIHSTEFVQPASEAALAAIVTTDLENANHISVFATGYGTDGIHDVHRKGSGEDGAIFIDPLSPKSHGFFFRFDTDTF